MADKPQISVILTTYNRPQYLAEAAESILTQTLRDLELVIVDDASDNPQTAQIAADIAARDARVRVIRRPRNGGPAAARNTGVAESQAPFIAFMDDDDISEPERLEKQVAFLMAHPDIAAVTCREVGIDQQGKIHRRHLSNQQSIRFCRPCSPVADPRNDDIPRVTLGADDIPFIHSTLVRRECFDAIGGFRECYRSAEDDDIRLRFQEKFAMAELPQALYRIRLHRGGRVSASPHYWPAKIAISISTYYRRTDKPDPMAGKHAFDEEFLLEHFPELPPKRRLYLIRKFSSPARRLLRGEQFSNLRDLHTLAEKLCTNINERHELSRVHFRMIIWSVIFGKWGFWLGRAGAHDE